MTNITAALDFRWFFIISIWFHQNLLGHRNVHWHAPILIDVSRSPAPFTFQCKLYIKYHIITAQARISLALTGWASEEIVSSAAERLCL